MTTLDHVASTWLAIAKSPQCVCSCVSASRSECLCFHKNDKKNGVGVIKKDEEMSVIEKLYCVLCCTSSVVFATMVKSQQIAISTMIMKKIIISPKGTIMTSVKNNTEDVNQFPCSKA